jgi:carboxypeptidase C (cathepsin A)
MISLRALLLAPLFALALPAFAADEAASPEKPNPEAHDKKPAEAAEKKDGKEPAKDVKEEKPKEKTGRVTLGGAEVQYIAQTGMMPLLKDDGTPRANVFYVYYAATDAKGKRLAAQDAGIRPITFCFNGGPGASAVWLHLGGLGPRRLDLPADGLTPQTVTKIADNPNSILDATDLVFVDPVSTGLSRAAKGEKADQFFNVEEDIQACGEFVRLFTTRQQRWESPKYLCGESYGVMRVSGLAAYLQEKDGLFPEGLVLMSGLIDFQTLSADTGNDLPYVVYVPAMTATAHYHKKLAPELQADLEKAVSASRAWAQSDYVLALRKGGDLTPEERHRIAEKLAYFTGLTVEQAEDQDLRIDPSFFRKNLLRKESKIIGRFDGRVIGDDGDRSEPRAEYDPSFSNIAGGFSSAVNSYIRGELGYESDFPYHILAPLPWKWSGFENRYVSTADKFAHAMKTNPRMRVLVLTGSRDLAVPEDSMRYSIAHMQIPKSVRTNIEFQRFESGHMMYLFQPDAEKLRRNLTQFITGKSPVVAAAARGN